MKKKTARFLAAVLILAMLLGACGSAPENGTEGTADGSEGEGTRDTLIIGNYCEPTVLDPPNQNILSSGVVNVQIFDGLVRYNNETGEIEPSLATSWEQVDDYTLRLQLREGVVFHDGSPFTAEDVKFTFDRGAESTEKAFIWEVFDPAKTKVIDEYTVEIGTYDKFPAMLTYLANNAMLIVSKHAVEEAGSDDVFGRNPVGTGPYKFIEWVAGDRVVMERNEDYWGEKPYFKTLIHRTIADDTTRAMALTSGEIDIALNLAAAQIEMLEQSPDVEVVPTPSYITQCCTLNQAYEPLSDVRVRKALNYAVDINTISEIAFMTGTVADGAFTPNLTDYKPADPDQEINVYDVEKAKALLKEDANVDGFDITLTCNETQPRITMAEMLANAWREIGINAQVQVMEFGAQLEMTNAGEGQADLLGFVAGGDDGVFFGDCFRTGGSWATISGINNPQINELFDKAEVEMDPVKRSEYYKELQDLIREERPWLFIRFMDNNYGIRSDLAGLDMDPEWYSEFRFVHPE